MNTSLRHGLANPRAATTGMADAPLPVRRRKRFSLSGTIGFERRIFTDQQRIAPQVQALMPPDHFSALFLCGTYGRGEGVRLRESNGREIATGYHYALIVGRTDSRLRGAIRKTLTCLSTSLHEQFRVPVTFRLIREEALYPPKLSLPLAELRWGGRLLVGDSRPVERMTDRPFEHLAPEELLWQLVEQGRGLLRNQQRLQKDTRLCEHETMQFFTHLIDSVLVCGDLRLAVAGRYHPSHPEKLARLQALEQLHQRKFLTLYQLAHEAYPDRETTRFATAHVLDWQSRALWLWLDSWRRFERWRHDRSSANPDASHPPRHRDKDFRKPGLLDRTAANWARMRSRWRQSRPLWLLGDSRERLIRVMPLLLSRPQTTPEPAVTAALSLPVATSWTQAVDACLLQPGWRQD